MKKSFLLLLCFSLVCWLCACSTAEEASASIDQTTSEALLAAALESDDPQPTATPTATTAIEEEAEAVTEAEDVALSIAYSTKGFNPYLTTDTLVEQTSSLLFENFIEISPDFDLEYRVAEQIVCTGTIVTITLRSSYYFADGTRFTVEDAYYSLLTAMQSTTYAARFSNVLEVAISEDQLILTLETPDSLFAYLLDIPILKEEDVASTTPTASGRYTYGAEGTTLVANPFALYPTDGPEEINLVAVTSYDEMMSALALGQTNYTVQSESSTGDSRISTTEHYYKTNTLLFLGINSEADNVLCNTAEGRTLLSALLDRDVLAVDTYDARAYTARGAINSFYYVAKDTQSILSTSDSSALAQTMADFGYTYHDETGYYQDETGANASVSILLHSANTYKTLLASEIIAQWAKYGIEATLVSTADFNSFLTLLESNEFELYIGEMKLYNNIELSSFWEGSASYGIHASEELLAAYAAFRADASQAAAFEAIFAEEMPYIPLLWKNGVVLTSRFASGVSASISNQFYELGELTFSN